MGSDPAPDVFREQLQARLGSDYTIERELGGGGMSRVFVALDTALGRRVVVKTLAPDFAASMSAERFRRETRLAASLQQANIVPVLSAGEANGIPYYAMPFVDGESLRARLSTTGALPIRDATGILRDVARALAFAHERGVVHRDIKPENVLLSGNTAVVTDFGIAKALESARITESSATLTQLGTAIGTPAYMAPEQASADPDVDHRADIYSFGVMAYELLSGSPPFTARGHQALFVAHLTELPVTLSQHRAEVPAGLASLVMRCLEKDPAARPQSAAEMLDVLEGVSTPTAVDTPVAPTRAAAKPSIAVMPFANLSPDPADEFFADGLTDEIITDLAPIAGLRVIARAAMMRFKGSAKDPQAVARELNVRYVLDGSVRRAGTSLRLTARLLDASDGSTIWSDKLGGTVEDVFAMQERVSRTIVDALKVTLSPREARQLGARPINDVEAYESYLQARQLVWTFTAASLDRALQLFESAKLRIGENPRLVAAVGAVHLLYIETGQVAAAPHLEAAQACVERLAVLDPDSFSLHSLRGLLQWRRGAIRDAIASLSRARELEPNNSDVTAYLAYAYLLAGQDTMARQMADALIEIDPLTPLFQCMPGFCELMVGRPAAAVAYYQRFLAMDPANPIAHMFACMVLTEADARAEAIEGAVEMARRFPGTIFSQLGLAYVHALRGERAAGSAALLPELRSLSKQSDMFSRPLVSVLTLLGEHDAAIDALEDAVRLGMSHYPYLARGATVIAPLRQNPRFRHLLDVVRGRWERGGTSAAEAGGVVDAV